MKRFFSILLVVWTSLLFMGACADEVGSPGDPVGKSLENVLKEYGLPDSEQTFEMSEAQNEFRIELQNTYPLTDPRNRKVKIRELSWFDKENVTTIWFHRKDGEWTALNILRWQKGTDF